MNQKQFLDQFDIYTNYPSKLKNNLIKKLKLLIAIKIVNGEKIRFPKLGNLFVQAQPPRLRHNIKTGVTFEYPAKNKVKMARSQVQQQILTPTWRPQVEFKASTEYPSFGLGDELAHYANIDLLTCQEFLNIFIDIIIEAGLVGEKVVISRLGTFKKELIDWKYLYARTPPMRLSRAAYSENLNIWVATQSESDFSGFLTSNSNRVFGVVTLGTDQEYMGIAWSPDLGIFCSIPRELTFTKVAVSIDGINWTEAANTSNVRGLYIQWDKNSQTFINTDDDFEGNYLAQSADGLSWSKIRITGVSILRSVVYSQSASLYVASGFNGSRQGVAYSADLATWSFVDLSIDRSQFYVSYNEKLDLFIAANSLSTDINIWISSDGVNWFGQFNPTYSPINNICSGSGFYKFVISTWNSGSSKIIKSVDGINWEIDDFSCSYRINDIVYSEKTQAFLLTSAEFGIENIIIGGGGMRFNVALSLSDDSPTFSKRGLINYRPADWLEKKVN